MSKVNIKIKAYEASLVDSATKKIVEASKVEGAKIIGPIPLPTKRERFTILKSVHIHKKSREQFEMKTHKRLIVLEKTNKKLMDKLTRLEIPSGIQVEVKIK
jgi:small subunit ribosomal protein S10